MAKDIILEKAWQTLIRLYPNCVTFSGQRYLPKEAVDKAYYVLGSKNYQYKKELITTKYVDEVTFYQVFEKIDKNILPKAVNNIQQKDMDTEIYVVHAESTSAFKAKNYDNWLEFWSAKVNLTDKEKTDYIKGIGGDLDGAHVLDEKGQMYITPCPSSENTSQKGGIDITDVKILPIDKKYLVPVSNADTKIEDNSMTWEKMKEDNDQRINTCKRRSSILRIRRKNNGMGK